MSTGSSVATAETPIEDDEDALKALENLRSWDDRRLHGHRRLPAVHSQREAGVTEKGRFEGRGPVAILLIVLVGGLALNLTPCVLPMIPINLAIIGAGVQAGSRTRGFLLGAVYGAAMALVYGVLGLIVILAAGTFGTINSSPWFNLGIAVLFVVLALAMFDVLVIDFSRLGEPIHIRRQVEGRSCRLFDGRGRRAPGRRVRGARRHSGRAVFEQLVRDRHDVALALPFFLGVGMALPWPIAGAGIAALPKPGAWMVRVKQAFGVFILATAAYYGYPAYGLFADRWVDPAEVASSVEEKLKEGWHASLAKGWTWPSASESPSWSTCGQPGARTA